jgi:hypothetical protein
MVRQRRKVKPHNGLRRLIVDWADEKVRRVQLRYLTKTSTWAIDRGLDGETDVAALSGLVLDSKRGLLPLDGSSKRSAVWQIIQVT